MNGMDARLIGLVRLTGYLPTMYNLYRGRHSWNNERKKLSKQKRLGCTCGPVWPDS